LKLFGGVLEMEAKREVAAVRVGEDSVSPRAIATFCHNKNHLATLDCLNINLIKIFSIKINNFKTGTSFIS